jgi:hypothetical protein
VSAIEPVNGVQLQTADRTWQVSSAVSVLELHWRVITDKTVGVVATVAVYVPKPEPAGIVTVAPVVMLHFNRIV